MQHRFPRAALGATTTVCLLLLSVATAFGQSPSPGTVGAPATYTGTIEKTGSAPTVKRENGNGAEQPLIAGPNATIVRGDKTIKLADLKKGDIVTVTNNPDSTAARIEAIPVKDDSGGFKWWWLVPLLLLIPLIWLMTRRKKKDDFVVERNQGDTTPTRERRPGEK